MIGIKPRQQRRNGNGIPHRVQLVGAGGIHMSGIGQILLQRGHVVTGSDLTLSEHTERLVALGGRAAGQAPEHGQPPAEAPAGGARSARAHGHDTGKSTGSSEGSSICVIARVEPSSDAWMGESTSPETRPQ